MSPAAEDHAIESVNRMEDMLERERIANRKKHWVRLVTTCNHKCLFCLDADTPRNVTIPLSSSFARS